MKRLLLAVLTLVLAVCFLPAPVYALGAAMAPATMGLTDVLRGSEYQRSIAVFNPSVPQCFYNLRTEGEAAGWLSLLDFDTQQPIQQVLVPAQKSVYIILKVNIPPDAANGSYTATIYSETAPVEVTGGSGVSAVMQAKCDLTISITGTQKIAGSVGSVTVHDTEVGSPAHFAVNFDNKGNVVVSPAIDCKINLDGSQVGEITEDKTPVNPGSQGNIGLDWDTNGAKTGDYTAEVAVTLDGKLLNTQKVSFKVMPVGTLTTNGELTNMRSAGQAAVGQMTKLLADFKNTGEADAKAKLTVEVNKDGTMLDLLESEEVLVPMGKTGTLTAYFKPGEKGKYTLNGVINYAGKQTNAMQLTLTVGDTGQANAASGNGDTGKSFNMLYPVGGGAAILILAAVVLFTVKKRRSAL